jgi:hypothetical protein
MPRENVLRKLAILGFIGACPALVISTAVQAQAPLPSWNEGSAKPPSTRTARCRWSILFIPRPCLPWNGCMNSPPNAPSGRPSGPLKRSSPTTGRPWPGSPSSTRPPKWLPGIGIPGDLAGEWGKRAPRIDPDSSPNRVAWNRGKPWFALCQGRILVNKNAGEGVS